MPGRSSGRSDAGVSGSIDMISSSKPPLRVSRCPQRRRWVMRAQHCPECLTRTWPKVMPSGPPPLTLKSNTSFVAIVETDCADEAASESWEC